MHNNTKVKICGMTNIEDAIMAVEAGADALGFIFYPKSPRSIDTKSAARIIKELPPFVLTVGVFVNDTPDLVNKTVAECGLDRVQLHGTEGPEYCAKVNAKVIKALRVSEISDISVIKEYCVSAYLLDAYHEDLHGGTGKTFDWDIAVAAKRFGNIILSGGLTPENVQDGIRRVKPSVVDVCTGVESRPGKKDPEKIKRFIEKVKNGR